MFISFGHQDASELSERLYSDLKGKGYSVWWDAPEIRASEHWDFTIEEGLQDSSVVRAVLTPHSTRRESVCRDEWAYALVAKRVLVPVRADTGLVYLPARHGSMASAHGLMVTDDGVL